MNPLEPMLGTGDASRLRPRRVLSTDVFEWPEFKALASRLGINLEMTTSVLTIQLAGDRPVAIVHEYEAGDTKKLTRQPSMKQYNDKKGGQIMRCSFHSKEGAQCVLDAGHLVDCQFKPQEPTT